MLAGVGLRSLSDVCSRWARVGGVYSDVSQEEPYILDNFSHFLFWEVQEDGTAGVELFTERLDTFLATIG